MLDKYLYLSFFINDVISIEQANKNSIEHNFYHRYTNNIKIFNAPFTHTQNRKKSK